MQTKVDTEEKVLARVPSTSLSSVSGSVNVHVPSTGRGRRHCSWPWPAAGTYSLPAEHARILTFHVQDAARLAEVEQDGAAGLVTTFDAVHDQADPDAVVRGIRHTVADDGVYLSQEIDATSTHHGDVDHPLGPLLYTISCRFVDSVADSATQPTSPASEARYEGHIGRRRARSTSPGGWSARSGEQLLSGPRGRLRCALEGSPSAALEASAPGRAGVLTPGQTPGEGRWSVP